MRKRWTLLGHLTTDDNGAIKGRIGKARASCCAIIKTLVTNAEIPIKYRLILLISSISSILLYGLRTLQLREQNIENYRVPTRNV